MSRLGLIPRWLEPSKHQLGHISMNQNYTLSVISRPLSHHLGPSSSRPSSNYYSNIICHSPCAFFAAIHYITSTICRSTGVSRTSNDGPKRLDTPDPRIIKANRIARRGICGLQLVLPYPLARMQSLLPRKRTTSYRGLIQSSQSVCPAQTLL